MPETNNQSFRFSIGRGATDSTPQNMEVASFADFARAVRAAAYPAPAAGASDEERARIKAAAPYYARAFKGGQRGKANVEPSRFVSLDLDEMTKEQRPQVCEACSRWKCFTYETASSTADAPRMRICIETDREILPSEVDAVTTAAACVLCEAVPSLPRPDACSGREAQLMFVPTQEAAHDTFNHHEGQPLPVEEALERYHAAVAAVASVGAPKRKRGRPRKNAAAAAATEGAAVENPDAHVLDALMAAGLYVRDAGGGEHVVRCPFEAEHTEEHRGDGDTSAVFFGHGTGGRQYGCFSCLHAHCKGRPQADFFGALGLDRGAYCAAVDGVQGTPECFTADGYRYTNDGHAVCFAKRTEDGYGRAVALCGALTVEAWARNAEGGDWGLLAQYRDADGFEREEILPREDAAGDPLTLWRRFARNGLPLYYGSPNKGEHLSRFLMRQPCFARVRTTDRTGWLTLTNAVTGIARRLYILPGEVLGQDPARLEAGEEEVRYFTRGGVEPAFSVKGTAEEWRECFGPLLRQSRPMMLAVAAALAAPCLYLLDGESAESGGFNFFGASGCGKSSIVKLAASVYGPAAMGDKGGRLLTLTDTANSIEGSCIGYNDSLLTLDEAGGKEEKQKRDLASIVYRIASGLEKGRMNADGTARNRRGWRLLVLTSAEGALRTFIERAGGTADAGTLTRIIDIDAAEGGSVFDLDAEGGAKNTPARFERLNKGVPAHYGAVGREWLETLAALPLETVRDNLERYGAQFDALVAEDVAGLQQNRAARRFRLCAAAFAYASSLGTLPAGMEATGIDACATLFKAWARFHGTGNAEEETLLENLRAAIETRPIEWKCAASCTPPRDFIGYQEWRTAEGKPLESIDLSLGGEGSAAATDGRRLFYLLLPSVFKELAGNLQPAAAACVLERRGILGEKQGAQSKGKGRAPVLRYDKRHRIGGKGVWLYEINHDALFGVDAGAGE